MSTSQAHKAHKSSLSNEKKKKEAEKEKERSKAVPVKPKVPADAKKRFGRRFQEKVCELFVSDEPSAIEELRKMHSELLAYYNEHDLTELWLSEDEMDKDSRPTAPQKAHMSLKPDDRSSSMSKLKQLATEKEVNKSDDEPPDSLKSVTSLSQSTQATALSSSIVPQDVLFELSDDSGDEIITTDTSSTIGGNFGKKLKRSKDLRSKSPSPSWAHLAKKIKKSTSTSRIETVASSSMSKHSVSIVKSSLKAGNKNSRS